MASSCKVRTQHPCPWLQDHLCINQRAPKAQEEHQPPANVIMKSLPGQGIAAASSYILPDPRPESTRGYAPLSSKQHKHTSTQDRPSVQHTQQEHTREPRATASRSPSGLVVFHLERTLAFLPLESLKPRYTQELHGSERPAGQAPPLLAGELGLHPAGDAFLGPGASGLAPAGDLSRAQLILLQGKAGDPGGETAF